VSWMRHRDLAIVAALLLLAAVSFVLFIRSWRSAGARARAARQADGTGPGEQPADHVSKTRGLAGAEQRPPDRR
jgi:hypothetical protein